MLRILRGLLGLDDETTSPGFPRGPAIPGRRRPDPDQEETAGADSYFDLMRELEEAVSKRDYPRAARIAREGVQLVPALLRRSPRHDGRTVIASIPPLEVGGTMLALAGDDGGLREMDRVVRSNPDLARWVSQVEQHLENRHLFAAIRAAVEEEPGCMQSGMKDRIGTSDGRRVSTLISWLEKAGQIRRTKSGKTYALSPADGDHGVERLPAPVIGSHRSDRAPLQVRDILLDGLPYVPLPRAPSRWESLGEARPTVREALEDWFETESVEGWELESVESIPTGERPETAFRQIHAIDSGLVLLDDLGKSDRFGPAPASVLRLGRAGTVEGGGPLRHDVYRFGANALGRGFIAMSKGCVAHAYDADVELILQTDLRTAPEVAALRGRLGIGEDELKNHLRCVAMAGDNGRYLVTGVDEAWCMQVDGRGLWALRLPFQEGWERVAGASGSYGTQADVVGALDLFGLSLPVSTDDVKRRYRELAKQWHPDLNPGDPSATERMQAVTGAAEILTGIDPASMHLYAGTVFSRELSRREAHSGSARVTLKARLSGDERQAADWIYAAGFAGRSHDVFLAGYSGRVIHVDGEGQPLRAYDIGAVPRQIVDTGDYLYLLTDTRLYVLQGDVLVALVDTAESGDLVIAQTGFGIIEKNRFRWFNEDGVYRGTVTAKNPLRRVYSTPAGMVVETRQRRALIGGVRPWWS